MRTLGEVEKTARDEPAFSNGTEFEAWHGNWCSRCQHPVEVAWRNYEAGKRRTQLAGYEGGCPLLMVSMLGKTPTEWMEQPRDEQGRVSLYDRYHCIEFRGPDDGNGEPRPRPEPTDMDGLFDRPERRVRMLQQPQREGVSA